jgi:hypothetical protein
MTNGKGKLTSYSYTAYGKLKAVTNIPVVRCFIESDCGVAA